MAAATVAVGLAFTQSGPAAAQSEQYAIRGIGITKLELGTKLVNTLAVACITPGTNQFVDCLPSGTVTLKVSTTTKTKLKLTSTTIAKGTIAAFAVPPGGDGESGGRARAEASATVRKKLKAVKRVEVTYRLAVTSPIQTVLTKKLIWTTTSSGPQRLLLRSSGDSADLSGGGRG